MAWVWFAVVQLLSLLATVVGWVLLLPFCLANDWLADRISIKPLQSPIHRVMVDRWRFTPLNWVYGNPEDGVSGQQALIWAGAVLDRYMPNATPWWRAYCWSAWRNSADNLKYVFAWKGGPLKSGTWILGRSYVIGWRPENGFNVPVLNL